MSFHLLSLPLFISLPLPSQPSLFFLFYSQSARRSLNWSAFRRQSKSNQTLTSITNAPWILVKPRISTISVFRRTADNSGITALLKISTAPTVAESKERHIGIKHDKPLLLVDPPSYTKLELLASVYTLSTHFDDPMIFSFHPAV